ncbi:MAG: hypothetical protein CR979_03460 [Propionibacterium sp.]|nr:MAG: hypothetical protein CR979_03460 [Propionibacterium sp.]
MKQLPSGRAEVKTVFVNTAQHPHWVTRAWERAKEEVAQGRQVFIVCPRIDPDDDSSTDDFLEEIPNTRTLTAVTQLVAELQSGPLADLKIAAVHGKQPAAERDEIMVSFAAGELDVLVATTVVEVGVDIPNSSMMIIVDADRFGLSQLHQLRGRIGRGSHAGLCLLLAPVTDPESVANKRLQAMVDSRDGFELAETDLQLRREGNVLGAEQSGTTSGLKLLRVLEDVETIQLSKDIAEQVVTQDPTKSQPWVSDTLRQVAELEKWASRS